MNNTTIAQKILIVEDEDFFRSIVANRLKKEGYITLEATDGEDALRKLEKEIPDLIILDLMMPRLNGFEVLEQIRLQSKFSQIPIIILSNLGQRSDISKAMELGASEYIVKGDLSINEIIERIKDRLPTINE